MISDISEIRKQAERIEELTLSKYAVLSKNTRGREYPIKPCPLRTEFTRDRDRIIHCKSFRRLKHKTQVFFAPVDDHYRTRLTHTLEVSQIARTIARGLRLNEDLTEAIALGHDLGHTPFGHIGEDELDKLVSGGFKHNRQSLRVIEKLENGTGLNLTYEVRDGILNHRKNDTRATLEACVVSMADRIAYVNHDIDDAIRDGIITENDIPHDLANVLGSSHGERINTLICDVIKNSYDEPVVRLSDNISKNFDLLREYMFKTVYMCERVRGEEGRARNIIHALFTYYTEHSDELPDEYMVNISDGLDRVAADYIACMTDGYAIKHFCELFVPHGS